MNYLLPHYFNNIEPRLPDICIYYSIRAPLFTLPKINNELIRTLIKYTLTNLLTHLMKQRISQVKFTFIPSMDINYILKNSMMQKYNDACITRNCYVCNSLDTL